MIKIIPKDKPYTPDIGDILYGNKYVSSACDPKSVTDFLVLTGYHLWKSLSYFNIDYEQCMKDFEYQCPFSGNLYYWFVPVALIIRNGSDKYRPATPTPNYEDDYRLDVEWHSSILKHDLEKPNNMVRSFLGHGYTNGTLPSDGSNCLHSVLLNLDNGDSIFGFCWIWYNK